MCFNLARRYYHLTADTFTDLATFYIISFLTALYGYALITV